MVAFYLALVLAVAAAGRSPPNRPPKAADAVTSTRFEVPPGLTITHTRNGMLIRRTTAAGAAAAAVAELALEVGSPTAFRLGVSFDGAGTAATPLQTHSLDKARTLAPFANTTAAGGFVGITTAFGSLLVDSQLNWRLEDASGVELIAGVAPNLTVLSDQGRGKANGSEIVLRVSKNTTGPGAVNEIGPPPARALSLARCCEPPTMPAAATRSALCRRDVCCRLAGRRAWTATLTPLTTPTHLPDWFGSTQSLGCMCGTDGENGELASGDFGYKGKIWANQSFASIASKKRIFCKGPADVLAHFHDDLDMKFGAIRKPRSYSNLNLSCAHGWALAPGCDQFTPARPYRPGATVNWNYSTPEFRSWYAAGHAHFLKDGIDFWWNDEGEKQWYGNFGKLSTNCFDLVPSGFPLLLLCAP